MQLTLNRNAWHRKLQKYVLGIDRTAKDDFPNLCPYFWLTVFCLFASPFVFFWRSPVQYAWGTFSWLFIAFAEGLEWLTETILPPIKDGICLPLDRAFVEPRRKRLMKLAHATQKAAPFILVPLGLAALWGAGWGVYKAAHLLCLVPWGLVWHWIGVATVFVLLCVIGALFGVSVCLIGKALFKNCSLLFNRPRKYKPKRPAWFWPAVGRGFCACGKPFVALATGVASAFVFIGHYIKATKEGYCPKIEWKE
jgi:hypothetical protein